MDRSLKNADREKQNERVQQMKEEARRQHEREQRAKSDLQKEKKQ